MNQEWTRIETTEGMEQAVMQSIKDCKSLAWPITTGNVLYILRNQKLNVPASINQVEAWIAKYVTTDAERNAE